MSDDKNSKDNREDGAGGTRQRIAGGFPIVNLQKAITMMKAVWDKEKRNAAPATAIAEHWGYSAKSSGGHQAIASLKRFGLLQEVTGGQVRMLKVSDMAMNLMKFEDTDAVAYRKQLKSLALLPSWYQLLWNKYGADLPSDKNMESFLVFDNHMEEPQAKLLMRTYKETISFAKMTSSDKIEEAEKQQSNGGGENSEKPPKNDVNKPENMDLSVKPDELPVPIAGRVARIPFPMTADDFDLFIGTLQLWKKKLVKTPAAILPKIALPANAMWKNKDNNKPVKIVAVMGEKDGEIYYRSEDGTGIPSSQLVF